MRILQNVATLAVACALLLQSCAGYEPAYSAAATECWVLDAASGKPIEGVIAVAHWELSAGVMATRSRLVQLKVLETLTDMDGRFLFPAWGPEGNPSMIGYIEDNDPGIIVFKSGYAPRFLQNAVRAEPRAGALRHSDWNGKKIELRRAPADPEAYLAQFKSLSQILESVVRDAKDCNWKKMPRMLRAVYTERQLLKAKGITGGRFGINSVDLYLIDNSDKFSREGGPECGSPRDFFESAPKE